MYSIKKHKKLLSSWILTRRIDIKKVLLISGVFKKNLNFEKEFSCNRIVRSCFINLALNILENSHLVKVENLINSFSCTEKFDKLIKSKFRLPLCSVYYKKLIFTDRKTIYYNSIFLFFIKVKLISILSLK